MIINQQSPNGSILYDRSAILHPQYIFEKKGGKTIYQFM